MKIVFASKFFLKGYVAIALYPFVIFKSKECFNLTSLNHEKIHLRQQVELLVVFFYIWYLLEFIIRYIQYRNWNSAYRNISFEVEAYQNETNLDYLDNRRLFSFLKYLKG